MSEVVGPRTNQIYPPNHHHKGRFSALFKCSNFKSTCFMLHNALLHDNFGIILCSKNILNEGPAALWSLAEHLSSTLEIQSTL